MDSTGTMDVTRADAQSAATDASLSRLPVLDAVRGVALLLVLVYHGSYFLLYPAFPRSGVDGAYWAVASAGWCGVDLFFVLSGFLITRILLHTRTAPGYLSTFYARRVLRIFPLYYGVLIAWVCAAKITKSSEATDAAPYLFAYCSNLIVTFTRGSFHVPLSLQHFWSLAIEEQFYLVWPLAVLAIPPRRLPVACALSVAGALLARVAFLAAGNDFGAVQFTFCRWDGLALGAAAAWAVISVEPALIRRWSGRTLVACLVALAVVAAINGGFHEGWLVYSIGISLLGVFFASVILMLVTAPGPRAAARSGIERALSNVGRYSYGMYVFHQPLMFFALKTRSTGLFFRRTLFGSHLPGQLVFTAFALSGTYALASLSFRLYEQPFLRLKRFFSYRTIASESAEQA